MDHLAAFVFAPIIGRYGSLVGAKYVYNFGAFVQGIAGTSYGFLVYVHETTPFLALSYFLRFLDGLADAAARSAVLSILITLYPTKVATVMSWAEMAFGFGSVLGPAIGTALYGIGGFSLPFWVVGSLALLTAVCLAFVVPNVDASWSMETLPLVGDSEKLKARKDLTFKKMILVRNPNFFLSA